MTDDNSKVSKASSFLELAVELPILDHEILENLKSLDDYKGVFLDELITIYEDMTPSALETLITALDSGTPKEVMRLAHKVKGMVGNLGAQRLSAFLQSIELSFPEMTPEDISLFPALLRHELNQSLKALLTHRTSSNKIAS